ncbi:response regulator transcription factor [Geodermatophilus sp. SYSU D01105]
MAELAATGLSAREIGARLFIGERTVEGHLARTYARLGVRSRVELARYVAAEGLSGPGATAGAGPGTAGAGPGTAGAGPGAAGRARSGTPAGVDSGTRARTGTPDRRPARS